MGARSRPPGWLVRAQQGKGSQHVDPLQPRRHLPLPPATRRHHQRRLLPPLARQSVLVDARESSLSSRLPLRAHHRFRAAFAPSEAARPQRTTPFRPAAPTHLLLNPRHLFLSRTLPRLVGQGPAAAAAASVRGDAGYVGCTARQRQRRALVLVHEPDPLSVARSRALVQRKHERRPAVADSLDELILGPVRLLFWRGRRPVEHDPAQDGRH